MVIGGACGFREFGRTVNDGSVAGVSRLFRNGTGCGACYQVKWSRLTTLQNTVRIILYKYNKISTYEDIITFCLLFNDTVDNWTT